MAARRRIRGLLLFLLLSATAVYSQIFKFEGGTSTMLESEGARLTVSGPYFDSVFSVGQTGNGGWLYGAAIRKRIADNTVTAGDQFVSFQLPTDLFAGSGYYSMRGMAVERETSRYKLQIGAGLTTSTEGTNFFQTARKDNAFGSLQLDLKASEKLHYYGRLFFSDLHTAIAGLSYFLKPNTQFSMGGGIGANKPYGAVSFLRNTRTYDLQAQYVAASLNFSRMFLQTPRFTEPHGLNVLGRYRPYRWLYLTGSHQNSVDPYAEVPQTATINTVGAGAFLWKAHVSANAYNSKSAGIVTNGFSVAAGRPVTRWLEVDGDLYRSRSAGSEGSQIEDIRMTEKITQALTITEYFTRSSGRNSLLVGGTYIGRYFSLSLNNNIDYSPFERSGHEAGFQSFYSASLSFPFLHNSTAEFHANIDPDGKVEYTAAGGTTFYRFEGLEPDTRPRFDIGKFLIAGVVTDDAGRPVEGAVVRVGKHEVFTDREGKFELRNHKQQTEMVAVPVEEFFTSFDYEVVQSPPEATFLEEGGKASELKIIVRRVSTAQSQEIADLPMNPTMSRRN